MGGMRRSDVVESEELEMSRSLLLFSQVNFRFRFVERLTDCRFF